MEDEHTGSSLMELQAQSGHREHRESQHDMICMGRGGGPGDTGTQRVS